MRHRVSHEFREIRMGNPGTSRIKNQGSSVFSGSLRIDEVTNSLSLRLAAMAPAYFPGNGALSVITGAPMVNATTVTI